MARMTLTAKVIKRLKAKGFDELFDKHEKKWRAMVATAVEYARTWIPTTEPVRAGDVATQIVEPLRVDEAFTRYLGEQGLTQQYWAEDFAEYILDRIYPNHIVEEK